MHIKTNMHIYIALIDKETGEVDYSWIVQFLEEADRDDGLTQSRLVFPRLKRRRKDFLVVSFLAALGEKQPDFPDSTLREQRKKL